MPARQRLAGVVGRLNSSCIHWVGRRNQRRRETPLMQGVAEQLTRAFLSLTRSRNERNGAG